jgi:hypothetical protein
MINLQTQGDRISADTHRTLYRNRLHQRQGWVPTREVLEIVVEGIASIKADHEWLDEDRRWSFPFYEFAMLAERWLGRERQKIVRQIELEERA